MMKENEFIQHLKVSDDFVFHLKAMARRHLDDGSGTSAGLVLTLAFEVEAYTREWSAATPHEKASPDVAASTRDAYADHPAAQKHRHDYEPSITRGDNPPVCACGKKKSPNGRPRTQQIIAPGSGGSS